jgi:hypothetical protein
MTAIKSTDTVHLHRSRGALNLARFHVGGWRGPLLFGVIVILAGLGLNWSRLVAAGIAPILLSVLPCLVMCGIGTCIVCMSGNKQTAPPRDAAGTAPSNAPGATGRGNPPAGVAAAAAARNPDRSAI